MKNIKTYLLFCLYLATLSACSSKSSEKPAAPKEQKFQIESGDVQVEESELKVPIKAKCIAGYANAVIQIGDLYKAIECKNGGFSYIHSFPTSTLKENRAKKKDYVLRIRGFHEEKKNDTLAQSLVVISYKDFQSKLVINQSLTTLENQEGLFSDLGVFGQCAQGSTVEVEIFDDWRGVSLEEETLPCTEAGFAYFSRRPGQMKKGMRLLLREMRNEKPMASYEVVLFN